MWRVKRESTYMENFWLQNKNTLYERAMKHTNDKLGWWALYFVYCLIPIALYAWYLSRRAKDKEVLNVNLYSMFTG